MGITKYWLAKALGNWRMFWGFCPKCNSIPEGATKCEVCKGLPYTYTEGTKAWKRRYLKVLEDLRSSDTNKPN